MRDKLLVDARQRLDVGLELFWDEAKHTGCFFATAAALPSSCFAFAPVHADCGILHTSVDPALTYFHTGVVGMSDGWTDPNGRPLMNVLAATPKGSCFLFSENCEGHVKDAQFTADVWAKGVERMGADNVFCFIADGASVNNAAARIFEERWATHACHPSIDLSI